MINIYKNDNNELECHIKYMGSDFKFQAIKKGMVTTFEGSNTPEYFEFEDDELGYDILEKVQDVMVDIVSISNWREGLEDNK